MELRTRHLLQKRKWWYTPTRPDADVVISELSFNRIKPEMYGNFFVAAGIEMIYDYYVYR